MQHILMELKQINDELSYEIDVATVVDAQALDKVLAQLSQKAVYICVCGCYNAGKSTLINALLRSQYVSKLHACICQLLPPNISSSITSMHYIGNKKAAANIPMEIKRTIRRMCTHKLALLLYGTAILSVKNVYRSFL